MAVKQDEVMLSVVIPAYNEADRITHTVQAVAAYLAKKPWRSEVLIVDDGSTDTTVDLVREYINIYSNLKLVRLPENQGKGAAVKAGVMAAKGEWILFMDADSSTDIGELDKLWEWKDKYDVVIGSRYLVRQSLKRPQPWYRRLLGRVGNVIIQSLLVPGIVDTQCGFKLYNQKVAQDLFTRLQSWRWSFDLEILAWARQLSYRIREVPVDWYDSPHGRVDIVRDSIRVLVDLFRIKYRLEVEATQKFDQVNWLYFGYLSGLFFIVYGLFSLIPHWKLTTHAYDLGIFNQALYQYAHGVIAPNTIRDVPILMADHFELVLWLLSPLFWLFGSYTLLLVQIIMVLVGGAGIFALVGDKSKNNTMSLLAVGSFFVYFSIFDALSFDYHNDVVGYMLLPWLFWMVERKKWLGYYLIMALMLISKETVSLLIFFWGISLLFSAERNTKKHAWATLIISGGYFIAVVKYIIPQFNGGEYDHLSSFDQFGSNMGEIGWNLLVHPLSWWGLMFDDPVKIKMWVMILLSGGVLALFKPRYSWLIIPIMAQKFLSANVWYWTHLFHYSVALAPIIITGAALAIDHYGKSERKKIWAMVGLFLVNGLILTQINFYDGTNVGRIFDPGYYQLPGNYQQITEAMNMIPADKSVSAQDGLVPHLTNRNRVYLFPDINDADYAILVGDQLNIWPVVDTESYQRIKKEKLDDNEQYQLIYDENDVCLYRRRGDDKI
ncbi:MAG: DUF2079 domain-containing protein [Patescibacteria group bacterium]